MAKNPTVKTLVPNIQHAIKVRKFPPKKVKNVCSEEGTSIATREFNRALSNMKTEVLKELEEIRNLGADPRWHELVYNLETAIDDIMIHDNHPITRSK